MTPHSHKYYITVYHISPLSVGIFFLLILNQHILLKSSVENITFGDKEKLLKAETFVERELPSNYMNSNISEIAHSKLPEL